MQETNVIKLLKSDLKFGESSISKLRIFVKSVIDANVKHNLISKNTENDIWHRHILDSAQLVKFINFKRGSLSDLGSGAGFPGIVMAIFNSNLDFHVKLYEKSAVKSAGKAIGVIEKDIEHYKKLIEKLIGLDTSVHHQLQDYVD